MPKRKGKIAKMGWMPERKPKPPLIPKLEMEVIAEPMSKTNPSEGLDEPWMPVQANYMTPVLQAKRQEVEMRRAESGKVMDELVIQDTLMGPLRDAWGDPSQEYRWLLRSTKTTPFMEVNRIMEYVFENRFLPIQVIKGMTDDDAQTMSWIPMPGTVLTDKVKTPQKRLCGKWIMKIVEMLKYGSMAGVELSNGNDASIEVIGEDNEEDEEAGQYGVPYWTTRTGQEYGERVKRQTYITQKGIRLVGVQMAQTTDPLHEIPLSKWMKFRIKMEQEMPDGRTEKSVLLVSSRFCRNMTGIHKNIPFQQFVFERKWTSGQRVEDIPPATRSWVYEEKYWKTIHKYLPNLIQAANPERFWEKEELDAVFDSHLPKVLAGGELCLLDFLRQIPATAWAQCSLPGAVAAREAALRGKEMYHKPIRARNQCRAKRLQDKEFHEKNETPLYHHLKEITAAMEPADDMEERRYKNPDGSVQTVLGVIDLSTEPATVPQTSLGDRVPMVEMSRPSTTTSGAGTKRAATEAHCGTNPSTRPRLTQEAVEDAAPNGNSNKSSDEDSSA